MIMMICSVSMLASFILKKSRPVVFTPQNTKTKTNLQMSFCAQCLQGVVIFFSIKLHRD